MGGYEALTPRFEDPLEKLRDEFDALVERMQSKEAKAAGQALFTASGRRLCGRQAAGAPGNCGSK